MVFARFPILHTELLESMVNQKVNLNVVVSQHPKPTSEKLAKAGCQSAWEQHTCKVGIRMFVTQPKWRSCWNDYAVDVFHQKWPVGGTPILFQSGCLQNLFPPLGHGIISWATPTPSFCMPLLNKVVTPNFG